MHEVIKAAESDIDVIVGLADAGLALGAEMITLKPRIPGIDCSWRRENAVNVVGFILVQLLCASVTQSMSRS